MARKKIGKIKRYSMELPVQLTPDEHEKTSERLARLLKEIDKLEVQRKVAAQQFKDQLTSFNLSRQRLIEAVDTHQEPRMVEVEEQPDFSRNRIAIVRTDTGETVSERAMDAHERDGLAQGDLIEDGVMPNGSDEARS